MIPVKIHNDIVEIFKLSLVQYNLVLSSGDSAMLKTDVGAGEDDALLTMQSHNHD